MIKVQSLSYSFPQKDLYKDITFIIEEGQHCAFIGASGSGKSTLIDIILDNEKYVHGGKIEINENIKIGYVSQFENLEKSKKNTVFEYVGEKFIKLKNEIDSICEEMGTSSDLENLMIKYQEKLDELESIGGDNFENNINKKLNLAQIDKDKKINELSGGEFKLVQVVKEMIDNKDLMIMDEPDAFLDFDNLNSLKDLINSHKKTMLVITHNRYLLNHCFDKIIHLENCELQEFDGRYADYNLSLLNMKIELQELSIKDDEEIKRNEELIDKLRFRSTYNTDASSGRALKARMKIQERLQERKIKAPFVYIKKPNIDLINNNEIEETVALEVKDFGVSFDELLLENVNFEIKSNEKVAIVGGNGVGKTTLLKSIFNKYDSTKDIMNNSAKNNEMNDSKINFDKDTININENINMSYLSQNQDEVLDDNNTVLQEFMDYGFRNEDIVRRCVFNFGFNEKIVNQKIKELSGGEKTILQLAKISYNKANMLLLDEPTSHLDMYSQIALEEAIKNYNGAILMISHDYQFIANSMDYVLLIEDKTIRKMTIKKFRRMVHSKYFDKNYLEFEEKKKELEIKIEKSLSNTDFELARKLSEELENLIK